MFLFYSIILLIYSLLNMVIFYQSIVGNAPSFFAVFAVIFTVVGAFASGVAFFTYIDEHENGLH